MQKSSPPSKPERRHTDQISLSQPKSKHTSKNPYQSILADVGGKMVDSFQKKKNDIKLKHMYKYPANPKLGIYHRNANKVGRRLRIVDPDSNALKQIKACPCCENMLVTEEFPMDYPTFIKEPEEGEEKYQLQAGISMYFTFLKMITYFLLLRFLVFDIANIILSINGHYCSNLYLTGRKDRCSISISGYNLNSAEDEESAKILDVLALLLTIFSIAFFLIFRKIEHTQKNRSRALRFSQDNFSILIENVPAFIYDDYTETKDVHFNYEEYLRYIIQNKIIQWLQKIQENMGTTQSLSFLERQFVSGVVEKNATSMNFLKNNIVTSINLCYDLTEMENIFGMRTRLVEEHVAEADEDKIKESTLLKHIPNQIELLNKQYIRLCEEYIGSGRNNNEIDNFKLTHFSGKAFISFQYQHYRDYFIREYQANNDFLKISGKQIDISFANKPNDVYWYNMKITDSERRKTTLYSWAVVGMLLLLSLASLIGIEFWHIRLDKEMPGPTTLQAKIRSHIISAIMALLTTIINYILTASNELLSTLEKHPTKSDRLSSLMRKNLVTQTLNTCFIYVILYILEPSNPLGTLGMVNKIISLVVVSGLVSLLVNLFIPKQRLVAFYNSLKIKKDGPVNMFQVDLNKKMEYPEFEYPAMYAFYIVYSFVIAFYGFLTPLCTFFLIIIFYMHYWVDKYNLFRRFSSPVEFSYQLRGLILSSFELNVFFFAAGYFVWDIGIHHDSKLKFRGLNLINLIIAALFSGFSMGTSRTFKNKILRNQDEPDVTSYHTYMENPYNRFSKTFFNENPATSCLRDLSYLKDIESMMEIKSLEMNRKRKELQNFKKDEEQLHHKLEQLQSKLAEQAREKDQLSAILEREVKARQAKEEDLAQHSDAKILSQKKRQISFMKVRERSLSDKIDLLKHGHQKLLAQIKETEQKIKLRGSQIVSYQRSIEEDDRSNRKYARQKQIKQITSFIKSEKQIQQQRIYGEEPDPESMFITEEEVEHLSNTQDFTAHLMDLVKQEHHQVEQPSDNKYSHQEVELLRGNSKDQSLI